MKFSVNFDDLTKACREYEDQNLTTCAGCGFKRHPFPEWAKPGQKFGLNGVVYRVVEAGRSNDRGSGEHFENVSYSEPIKRAAPRKFPLLGSFKKRSKKTFFELPKFYGDNFERALFEVRP